MSSSAYNKQYRRTLTGLTVRIYTNQVGSSKDRNHPAPAYTKAELTKWLLAQPLYHTLHSQWVSFCYYKWLTPSVDRIDSTKPYTLDNIQLMTWIDNHNKGLLEREVKRLNNTLGVHTYKPRPHH